MRKATMFSAGLALLCMMAASGDALAKSRRHHSHSYGVSYGQDDGYAVRPGHGRGESVYGLQRRSFLEPAPVVPVGTTNRYMIQETYFNKDPLEANQRSWFMNETKPQRLYVTPYQDGQFDLW
jgi:hypothetical protein